MVHKGIVEGFNDNHVISIMVLAVKSYSSLKPVHLFPVGLITSSWYRKTFSYYKLQPLVPKGTI